MKRAAYLCMDRNGRSATHPGFVGVVCKLANNVLPLLIAFPDRGVSLLNYFDLSHQLRMDFRE